MILVQREWRAFGGSVSSRQYGTLSRSTWQKCCAIALLAQATGACTVIPADGPAGQDVRSKPQVSIQDPSALGYAYVKLSPLILASAQTDLQQPVRFSRLAETVRPRVRVGTSDVLSVTIFEAEAGGLFFSRSQIADNRGGN